MASLAGDTRASDGWFARAVRQAPRLAFAEFEWGRAKLRGRDLSGAIAKLEAAAGKAPRWADPLKYWGDALALQGRDREAVEKYKAAAERAPRWGALHLAWGTALWRIGERDEGREKVRAAATMDLTSADRERLRRAWSAMRGASQS